MPGKQFTCVFILSNTNFYFKNGLTLNPNVYNKAHHITSRGYQGTYYVQLN